MDPRVTADPRRRARSSIPRSATPLIAVLLLAACSSGGGGPTIDPGPDDDRGATDDAAVGSANGVADVALAPECSELEDRLYSPPAEEQPRADPALTSADAVPDISTGQEDGVDDGGATTDTDVAGEAPPDPMSAVRRWAEQEAPDDYAGMWFDPDEGATVVAFTDEVDAYAEEVRDRFGAGWWVVELEHSEADLRAVQDALTGQDLGGWAGDEPNPGDIYGVGSGSGPVNRVSVDIIEPDEARLAELSERYGADHICFRIDRLPTDEDAAPSPWEPAPDADLSPEATTIDVLVNEVACAGGQDCPGNPDTPFTVELDEPLGDRELLDGSQDPPAEPDLDPDGP